MGLRCLLGHDFGEPETERERNEEGNEVVVSVREVKTCRRCGETQVVSENKEIKSIDQLRESVTGDSPAPDTEAGVGMGEPDGFGSEEPTGTLSGESSTADAAGQWSADELELGGPANETDAESEAEPEPAVDEDEDIDRGVAEIIETAEKDEELHQNERATADEGGAESDSDADAEDADETPVHPAERAPAEDEEEADSAHEDAVILDDESPPEKGRGQWDEQAHPEEVPGRDKSGAEPRSSTDEDAIIMGEESDDPEPRTTEPEPTTTEPEPEPEPEPTTTEPEPEPEPEPTQEQTSTTQSSSEQPTAVESEDAEIMGGGTVEPEPEPEPSHGADVRDTTAEEPVTEEADSEETTDEGHMPWPQAPGEDEGDDAEAPDDEPTDVEFGGGITPDQPENDQNGADASTSSTESPPTEPEQSQADETDQPSSGRSSPEPTINLEQSSREAGLEYYCPECGLTRDVGNSSMRAGDICPECRKGYITERQKSE
ncbi:hypothetical protein Halar_0897 [halophilic archaeon DL31]|jgi:ribosomal protein L37AE/L43A|nr:hypothetical protein Halar_0897 [halophilic archaeon DL31]